MKALLTRAIYNSLLAIGAYALAISPSHAGIVNPDFNGNTSGWSFITSLAPPGYDTPNSPGSPGGSAYFDIAAYQLLSDTASGALGASYYDLSVWIYNDRNTLGTITANDSDPPHQDTIGLPLHLRLYIADSGEIPNSGGIVLLGSLSIGTGGNPLPNANTWGRYSLTVMTASIPALEVGKQLLISLETNALTSDSWVYSDQWRLTLVPEPCSGVLLTLALPFAMRQRTKRRQNVVHIRSKLSNRSLNSMS